MKKLFLMFVLVCVVFKSYSQDTTIFKNKKGQPILPAKGDISLGFNTFPIIDLFLGSLNRTTAYAGSSNIVQYSSNSNNQIVGKYFLDDKTAIRVRFGVNTLSGSITNKVQDSKSVFAASKGSRADQEAASLLRVDDKLSFSKSNWMLSFSYEKRRGYRRLQGVYGGEIGFGNTGSKQSIVYGNAFSDQYNVVYTNDFNALTTLTQTPLNSQKVSRTNQITNRGLFRFGARAFVGIEYFIFAKISIAAEYGWAYAITSRRASNMKQESYYYGPNGGTVVTETVKVDSKESYTGFSVDNNNGSVFSLTNALNGSTALSGGSGALTLLFHF